MSVKNVKIKRTTTKKDLKCINSVINELLGCEIQITNKLTGEVKYANATSLIDTLTTMISRDWGYSKMFNENFLNQWIKPFMPEKTYNVISFLILNRDKENCIFATAEVIAKYCNTTLRNTQIILKELMATKGIKRIQNGVYQVNLDAIFSGKASARNAAKEKFTKSFKYTYEQKEKETAKSKKRIRRSLKMKGQ